MYEIKEEIEKSFNAMVEMEGKDGGLNVVLNM